MNCLKIIKEFGVTRSLRPSVTLSILTNDIKLDLFLKVSFRNRALITMRLFIYLYGGLFRTITTFIPHYDLELQQMNVKTIIFNGSLKEEIYMDNMGASHFIKIITWSIKLVDQYIGLNQLHDDSFLSSKILLFPLDLKKYIVY